MACSSIAINVTPYSLFTQGKKEVCEIVTSNDRKKYKPFWRVASLRLFLRPKIPKAFHLCIIEEDAHKSWDPYRRWRGERKKRRKKSVHESWKSAWHNLWQAVESFVTLSLLTAMNHRIQWLAKHPRDRNFLSLEFSLRNGNEIRTLT